MSLSFRELAAIEYASNDFSEPVDCAQALADECCGAWGHQLAENYRPSDVCNRCGITGRQLVEKK